MEKQTIKAAIFDMDGLLIDSEPLWHIAEMETARSFGMELTLDQCFEATGLKLHDSLELLFGDRPEGVLMDDVEKRLVSRILELISERGEEKTGARYILDFMKKRDVRLALASSSAMNIIDAVLDRLDIRPYFEEVYSAQFEAYGKPHPGVYLTTAKTLTLDPKECLAFEDSMNGLLSAKAARMKCVSVPDQSIAGSPKLAIADLVLPTLSDFDEKAWKAVAL